MLKGIDLFNKFNGTYIEYDKLPECARKAIDIYFVNEFGITYESNDIFGYVVVPLNELIIAVQNSDEDYVDFEKYHQDYMSRGDVSSHETVWALILDLYSNDIILDGWHRFHSYIEKGINLIPMVFPTKKINNNSKNLIN